MGKGGGKGGASSAKQEAKPGFFEGFAGTTKGSFFEAPLWVDQSKPAGHSSQVSWLLKADSLFGRSNCSFPR